MGRRDARTRDPYTATRRDAHSNGWAPVRPRRHGERNTWVVVQRARRGWNLPDREQPAFDMGRAVACMADGGIRGHAVRATKHGVARLAETSRRLGKKQLAYRHMPPPRPKRHRRSSRGSHG